MSDEQQAPIEDNQSIDLIAFAKAELEELGFRSKPTVNPATKISYVVTLGEFTLEVGVARNPVSNVQSCGFVVVFNRKVYKNKHEQIHKETEVLKMAIEGLLALQFHYLSTRE